jgi:hypothetical protein
MRMTEYDFSKFHLSDGPQIITSTIPGKKIQRTFH